MDDRRELTWRDLRKGDRVSHFDYGTGVIDSSGPGWIFITWDNPDEHLNHHTAGIARHLTLSPAVPGRTRSPVPSQTAWRPAADEPAT